MKTIYFVRHGQTLFNYFHKIQGACDSPLTGLGVRQALAVHDFFEDHQIHFDEAYCSTQERASDTLEIITNHQMPYTRLKNLCEKSHGFYEGADESLLPWRQGMSRNNPCFEPDEHVKKRMKKAVKEILERTQDGEQVLIVGHGTALRLFTRAVDPQFTEYGNCGVVKMLANNGQLCYEDEVEPAKLIK